MGQNLVQGHLGPGWTRAWVITCLGWNPLARSLAIESNAQPQSHKAAQLHLELSTIWTFFFQRGAEGQPRENQSTAFTKELSGELFFPSSMSRPSFSIWQQPQVVIGVLC